MIEQMQPNNNQENIFTPESITSIFKELIGEKEYMETQRLENEKGLYLLEFQVSKENGTMGEYTFQKEGRYGRNQASITNISVDYYDEDGIPTTGKTLANYIDGQWEIIGV